MNDYSFRRGSDRVRVPANIPSDSETHQSFADACNINNIIRKYRTTGLVDHVNRYQGNYTDYSNPVDYQTALNTIIAADEVFMSLPSDIRSRFENDPGKFLNFVDDPKNADALVEMGLAKKSVIPVSSPDLDIDQGSTTDSSDEK